MTEINRLFDEPVAESTAFAASDHMDYIADLISELESLASRQDGGELLRGLLALAYAEANRLAKR